MEEANLVTRRTIIENLATQFIQSSKLQENLTASEKRGLRKLTRRVKAGEIVITETDKSGKLCICSMDAYIKMGDVHAEKDRPATWEGLRTARS